MPELLGGEPYVSCSFVLPALPPASLKAARFKAAFKKDLSERQADINNSWLKIASALDPRFKDVKFLPRGERDELWDSLQGLLQKEPSGATPQPVEEPAKKRRNLLLFASESDSDADMEGPNRALNCYRAAHSISMDDCPLLWWSGVGRLSSGGRAVVS